MYLHEGDNVVLVRASTISQQRFVGQHGTICFVRPDDNLALVMFQTAAMHIEVNLNDLEKDGRVACRYLRILRTTT